MGRNASSGLTNAARDVSAAKIACGEAALLAARTALQVHGAIGYTREHGLGRYLTRVRALHLSWGTSDWHRRRILTELTAADPTGSIVSTEATRTTGTSGAGATTPTEPTAATPIEYVGANRSESTIRERRGVSSPGTAGPTSPHAADTAGTARDGLAGSGGGVGG